MGRRGRPRGEHPDEYRRRRRSGSLLREVLGGIRDLLEEILGEFALWLLACALLAGVGLGLTLYPRETIAVLIGVATLAVIGGWLLFRSARTCSDLPRGGLVVASMISLGLVSLVLMYGDPACGCLP